MTTSSLFAFYHVTTTEDWICDNIIKYYDAKTGQKRKEEIAGSCKKRKELEIVASPVSEYDITCEKKAQEILDDWKGFDKLRA
ncbi:hypothetical protein RirG_098140 [Rhizophagus irregularis DAOM 197198w]|uniref:Uncharacterized protein n=1 Tax=Rhizophagus irregularis (strain DAOM 197198w) TaxID=1432141 RepID=A0A015MR59_RHIIW|nr:hypothetical protein RirG_098140 [Rhizophagus irregularis DAOM 197198w]